MAVFNKPSISSISSTTFSFSLQLSAHFYSRIFFLGCWNDITFYAFSLSMFLFLFLLSQTTYSHFGFFVCVLLLLFRTIQNSFSSLTFSNPCFWMLLTLFSVLYKVCFGESCIYFALHLRLQFWILAVSDLGFSKLSLITLLFS